MVDHEQPPLSAVRGPAQYPRRRVHRAGIPADEATPENLSQAVLNLLFDGVVRARLETRFAAIARELRQDSAGRMAAAMLPLVLNRAAP